MSEQDEAQTATNLATDQAKALPGDDGLCVVHGFKMTRPHSNAWMWLGSTLDEVTESIRAELDGDMDLNPDERESMWIRPGTVTEDELANMGEFPGW